MYFRDDLSYQYVCDRLAYDISTGNLIWRNGVRKGKIAGSKHKNYLRLHFNNAYYLAHRIIWLLATGKWPKDQLDHRDGNGFNNKLSNLRPATLQQNRHNRKLSRNNKSGHKGVHWNKKKKKWQAQIYIHNELVYLGLFDNIIEAAKSYDRAAILYHGNFCRLNFPELIDQYLSELALSKAAE